MGTFIFAAFNAGGGSFASHVVLTFATTVCTLLVLFRNRILVFKKENFTLRFLWLHGVYALFCVTVLLSIIFGSTPQYGLSELLLYVNGGVMMFLFSGLSYEKKDLDFLVKGTLGVVLSISVVGLFFYITSPIPRLAGTFFNFGLLQQAAFNTYANVLVLVLPVTLYYTLQSGLSKRASRVLVLVSAILFTSLVLSFSRAAYISLVAILIPFLILMRGHGRAREIGLRVAAILMISVALFSAVQLARGMYFRTTSLFDKIMFSADEGSNSATERLDYWSASVEMIREKPLLGSGVLSFRFLYPQHQEKFGVNEDHPHNIFLKVGVENGVIALFLLGVFVLGVATFVVRAVKHNQRNSAATALVLGACAALIHNLLDFNFVVSNYVLLSVFIGVFLSSSEQRSDENEETYSYKITLGIVGVGMALISIFVLHESYYNRDLQIARAANTSEIHLARANNLFFKRDLSRVLSSYYELKYNETYDTQWLEKERTQLSKNTVRTEIDADWFAREGVNKTHYYERTGDINDYKKAHESLCNSIMKDPKNSMRYYYYFALLRSMHDSKATAVLTIASAEREVAECSGNSMSVLLNEYISQLEVNSHFAVASDNPQYVSLLLGLLNMSKEKSEFDVLWKEKQAEWSLLNSTIY